MPHVVCAPIVISLRMLEHYGKLAPIRHTIPLRLLAYHTACVLGVGVELPGSL